MQFEILEIRLRNSERFSGWAALTQLYMHFIGVRNAVFKQRYCHLFNSSQSFFQVTDFVIILNKRSAVDAFSKGGNLTLGGNFTIAAGPVGRNLEADVSLRSTAAIYTYSKTRGLFAGISVEGSGLIERKDANRK